ncbi:uncharacterized protein LOC131346832 isoform X2 [Hemibagrus wyckioides]|uniref:uncharacterized protein LOC131346832 isoform X2 n=1 Tax=Hemibagrus wyckioides TaxID=337641 RepID=UPI00266CB7C6|nr:uncharacterized protein LOC131346832 isoform X2 [Hemibagrus wyckioides]
MANLPGPRFLLLVLSGLALCQEDYTTQTSDQSSASITMSSHETDNTTSGLPTSTSMLQQKTDTSWNEPDDPTISSVSHTTHFTPTHEDTTHSVTDKPLNFTFHKTLITPASQAFQTTPVITVVSVVLVLHIVAFIFMKKKNQGSETLRQSSRETNEDYENARNLLLVQARKNSSLPETVCMSLDPTPSQPDSVYQSLSITNNQSDSVYQSLPITNNQSDSVYQSLSITNNQSDSVYQSLSITNNQSDSVYQSLSITNNQSDSVYQSLSITNNQSDSVYQSLSITNDQSDSVYQSLSITNNQSDSVYQSLSITNDQSDSVYQSLSNTNNQ